ncbi:unnamed protein product [Parnassius apollo]|uniref:(apollo) hypothetical protein n=1 Tax=Parnassius apollo TaxID=110799 RepID=A0A8S3WLX4_PARAO|nr:unnamed protein product [Parnassius apollo]
MHRVARSCHLCLLVVQRPWPRSLLLQHQQLRRRRKRKRPRKKNLSPMMKIWASVSLTKHFLTFVRRTRFFIPILV